MAAPTTAFASGTGTITATGEGNGLLQAISPKISNARMTVGVSGTFTSLVLAVRGNLRGITSEVYYPITGKNRGTGLNLSNSASISLTNSTEALFEFDVGGLDNVEVYAASGTPTSLVVESRVEPASGNSTPTVVSAISGSSTFAGGLVIADNQTLGIGTDSDLTAGWDGTDIDVLAAADNTMVTIGATGNSFDFKVFGAGAATYATFDASADSFKLEDNVFFGFGSNTAGVGTKGDINITWNATKLLVAQTTPNSAIDLGVSGAGIDLQFYGDTAGYDLLWDQSADSLLFADNAKLAIGTGSDIVFLWDATDLLVSQLTADSSIKWGVSGAGINHVFYGDTATYNMTWDQTNDQLLFNDSAKLSIGTGAGGVGDIALSWDATRLNVTQLTANSEVRWGVDGAGIDQMWYGDTASTYVTWDQSADSLILAGVAKIKAQTIAAATGTAIPVTHSGSFPITQAGAETNTLADPSYLGQWLSIFVDTDTAGARVITAASRINQAANTIITLTEVGDFIKLEAITIAGALKWQVVSNDGAVLS